MLDGEILEDLVTLCVRQKGAEEHGRPSAERPRLLWQGHLRFDASTM
jgi:hypothetical protein